MSKPMIKRHKVEQVKQWINKLTTTNYGMQQLQPYNGDELDRMSIDQIEMLERYIRVVYHHAFRAGAEFAREK